MEVAIRGGGEDDGDGRKMKKIKVGGEGEGEGTAGFPNLDENLLYEVLKHVDARTLGRAACVSKQWHRTAQDERLWELICTRQGANIGCSNHQLRSVVLALGGFRHLHSLFLWPLSNPPPPSSSSTPAPPPASASSWPFPGAPMIPAKTTPPPPPSSRLSKDEIHLSLSLFSIRYYERMNPGNQIGRAHV